MYKRNIDLNIGPGLIIFWDNYAFQIIRCKRPSIWEIKEVVGGVIILSHWIAAGNVVNQSWSPGKSDPLFVEVVNEPSFNKILLEPSVHEMEVQILSGWGSGVNDTSLNNNLKRLLFHSQSYRDNLQGFVSCPIWVFPDAWYNVSYLLWRFGFKCF